MHPQKRISVCLISAAFAGVTLAQGVFAQSGPPPAPAAALPAQVPTMLPATGTPPPPPGAVTAPPPPPAIFPDVPAENPHAAAIKSLKESGVIAGYSDGTFKPANTISRAEALAILLKAAGHKPHAAKIHFTDVSDKDWFYGAVQTGIALGKIKGYGDKTFRPTNPITLPEALALTISFFNASVRDVKVESVIYPGLERTDWYAKYAQYAKDKNLIEPDATGVFDVDSALTRGQLAELAYRMKSATQSGKPFDITRGWKETTYLENFWKLKYPADFELFQGQKNSVLWKRGEGQVFFTRVWPEGARISISLVENPENLTAAQYFARAKTLYEKRYPKQTGFTETLIGGRSALVAEVRKKRLLDVIIALPTKNFLVFYGEYGEAPIGEFLRKQMREIFFSYQYVERPPAPPPPPPIPIEKRLETLRENILVAGKWKEVGPLFPDKILFSTDAIGVGTGPVDYYYSQEAGQTIKLERSSGTILNMREGKTQNF